MLQLLKDTVSSRHSERLETIVIILIGVEICESHTTDHCVLRAEVKISVLGIITILVDLLA